MKKKAGRKTPGARGRKKWVSPELTRFGPLTQMTEKAFAITTSAANR